MNCSSCESMYKLCRLSLNITTTDCLDEHCSNTTTESSQPISSAQGIKILCNKTSIIFLKLMVMGSL